VRDNDDSKKQKVFRWERGGGICNHLPPLFVHNVFQPPEKGGKQAASPQKKGYESHGTKDAQPAQTGTNWHKPAQNGTIFCAAGLFYNVWRGGKLTCSPYCRAVTFISMHPSRASCLAGCRVASPQAATSHLPAPAPLVAPLSIIALPPLVPLMPLVRLVVVSPIFTPPPPIIQRLRLLSRHCCRALRLSSRHHLLLRPSQLIVPSPLAVPLLEILSSWF